MIVDGALTALGLALLILAGDMLIRGAVGLAQKLGLSSAIIGLTVVSFGTSAPELLVTHTANMSERDPLALGNIMGSNVANILLVLGASAMLGSIPPASSRLRIETYFMTATTLLFAFVLIIFPAISYVAGMLFLGLLAIFLARAFKIPDPDAELEEEGVSNIWLAILLTIGGLILLPVSADILVTSASNLALGFGVSEAAIGLSIVAIGTSLPELAASMMAMVKGKNDIALGNIIGSNLFNIAFIIGLTTLVDPIDVDKSRLPIDLSFLLAATCALTVLVALKKQIDWKVGSLFLSAYIAFIALVF